MFFLSCKSNEINLKIRLPVMFRHPFCFLLFSAIFAIADDFRTWSNADKTKTFEGQFVRIDEGQVTIRLKNHKNLTFTIDKLHPDDQAWIHSHQPGQAGNPNGSVARIENLNPDAVFDTLTFGDHRDSVTQKLQASSMVRTKFADTLLGRTGLNGIFHTTEKIGGFTHSLSFDWDENGKLIEITLQSETRPSSEYETTLKSCWQEISAILVTIYGKPKTIGSMARISELGDDQMLPSHVWRLPQGGSCLLGSSKMEGGYQIVIRFTKQSF
ncbi:MAG: hypothetical protein RL346_1422 [Verrucomicrobiota bacterium]